MSDIVTLYNESFNHSLALQLREMKQINPHLLHNTLNSINNMNWIQDSNVTTSTHVNFDIVRERKTQT